MPTPQGVTGGPPVPLTRRGPSLLLAPAACWLGVFFLMPLVIVFVYSFCQRGPYGTVIYEFDLTNYRRALDPLYLTIVGRSFRIALVNTLCCLVVAYPFAYWIAFRRTRDRSLLLLFALLPFWTNFLVRTYAWLFILRTEGLINTLLMRLGVISAPLDLLYNDGAVTIGLIYGYLPFMVLPLYASLEKMDRSLLDAARDLGANTLQTHLRLTIPLTLPGVVAGCLLVFIPSLGAFVIPDILGGAKSTMIGNVIQSQFLTARDWPFGSALSFLLTAVVLGLLFIQWRMERETT